MQMKKYLFLMAKKQNLFSMLLVCTSLRNCTGEQFKRVLVLMEYCNKLNLLILITYGNL